MRSKPLGFTLIELLITLGLLAALTALLAPSLLTAGQGVSLTTHAKDLQSLLNGGRSLAMIHQQSVFVCGASSAVADASPAPEPCDTHGEWGYGLHVVLDSNSNQAPDVDDSIQLFQPPYPGHTTLIWKGFRGKHPIEFLAEGITNRQNGRFTFCTRQQVSQGLEVVLNAAGHCYIGPLIGPCSS